MVNKTKILSDLSKMAVDAASTFSGIKKEVNTIVRLRIDKAINKMQRALDEFLIEGVNTTIPFHQKVMAHPKFLSGKYTTKFMDTFEM